MRAKFTIVRDRDCALLEEEVTEVSDARSIGAAITRLLVHIQSVHPNADLSKLTIKVNGADE